jgi:hypothetical protein
MRKQTVLALFASILTMCIIFSACQPTPQKPTVIRKDNFEIIVDVTASPIPQSSSDKANSPQATPEQRGTRYTWSESTEFHKKIDKWEFILKLNINVDAVVDTENLKAGVYLVEPEDYAIDFAKRAAKYYMGDEYHDTQRTKDDVMMQILQYKKYRPYFQSQISERWKGMSEKEKDDWFKKQYKDNMQLDDQTHNDNLMEHKVDNIDTFIQMLQWDYENAPEKSKPAKFEFKKERFDYIGLKGYPYSGAISELYMGNGGKGNTTFYYVVDDIRKTYYETFVDYSGTPSRGMKTSYEDALKLATDAVTKTHDKEMRLAYTRLANVDYYDETWEHSYSTVKSTKCDQCYIFIFTPVYDGVQQIYSTEASNADDRQTEGGSMVYERGWDYEYSMKWPAEYACVYVDDSGIVESWAISPTKIVETKNSDVQMLSFDEIFERFKKHIFYCSAWTDSSYNTTTIDIDEIKFGMIRVPK